MSNVARLLAACVLAVGAGSAPAAPGLAQGDPISVEVSGPDRDVVRLVDATTHATIVLDRIKGGPLRDSLVSPDNAVVAVRRGAGDDGDSLVAYAIAWTVDPVSGAKVGRVSQVLDYRPRDGHLDMTLRQVPNGTVLQVRTGRQPPLWSKIFLHEHAGGTWIEWPRALAPADPTEGMPATVGDTDKGIPYAAWLRRPHPPGD